MNAREVLVKARDLLSASPNAWSKGAYFGKKGHIKTCTSIDLAECYCLYGAIWKAAGSLTCPEFDEAQSILLEVTKSALIETWNDHPDRTYQEILDAINEGIEFYDTRIASR